MLRPHMTTPRIFRSLRLAARPSAAVAAVPAPAPITPVGRRRAGAAVTTAWGARSAHPIAPAPAPTPTAAPLGGGAPAVTISPGSPGFPAPVPATPLGLARRGRGTVGTVTAIAHLATVPRREGHSVTAVTPHDIALAHRRHVGAPPRHQRSVGDAEPRAHAAD